MFSLPALPFDYNALEPFIDEETMKIHHDLHHGGYVNKLNAALKNYPEFQDQSIEKLLSNIDNLPDEIKTVVRNNGGGHFNHSMFWNVLSNEPSTPSQQLLDSINNNFESLEGFKKQFSDVAINRFGSGWAWLVKTDNVTLQVLSTPNQDNPLMDKTGTPILALDVWEHAYYLKYRNKRADYVNAFWNIVNWQKVSELFAN